MPASPQRSVQKTDQYFRCLGLGEKRAKGAMIKLANSSREGSILIEHATKEAPLTGTSYRSVRRPSYFYVMRRSGAEPEPKCGSKVHEASLQADEAVMKSPYETSLPRVGKLDVGRITSWLPNEEGR